MNEPFGVHHACLMPICLHCNEISSALQTRLDYTPSHIHVPNTNHQRSFQGRPLTRVDRFASYPLQNVHNTLRGGLSYSSQNFSSFGRIKRALKHLQQWSCGWKIWKLATSSDSAAVMCLVPKVGSWTFPLLEIPNQMPRPKAGTKDTLKKKRKTRIQAIPKERSARDDF